MVNINGVLEEKHLGQSIQALLESRNANFENVVVEYNGKIVRRHDYSTMILKENDTVEIISFVGGG